MGKADPPAGGKPTKEPAFGMTGWWVPSEQADAARRKGFTVVDAVSVMGTHLAELIRRYAHELFSRQDAKKFLDRVAVENPKVVEDLVPKLLPLSAVQRVLQNLLRERVSIRDSVTILEALGEAAVTIRNPVLLTEYVRQALRRIVVKPYLNANGELPAYLLDPQLEQTVESAVEHGEQNSHLTLAPHGHPRYAAAHHAKTWARPETPIAVIASSGARYFLRQMAEPSNPQSCSSFRITKFPWKSKLFPWESFNSHAEPEKASNLYVKSFFAIPSQPPWSRRSARWGRMPCCSIRAKLLPKPATWAITKWFSAPSAGARRGRRPRRYGSTNAPAPGQLPRANPAAAPPRPVHRRPSARPVARDARRTRALERCARAISLRKARCSTLSKPDGNRPSPEPAAPDADQLAGRFEVQPEIGRITVLVGPPGSGKTTTLVKLAVTECLKQGRPVRLLTTDTLRIGAADSCAPTRRFSVCRFRRWKAPPPWRRLSTRRPPTHTC